MSDELLEVIDEQERVVGLETRENIHRQGLLHREVHVIFVTPQKEIIFQHRAKDKDTFPDLLDWAASGHFVPRDDCLKAALREVQEETGLCLLDQDIHFIRTIRMRIIDLASDLINNSIKYIYFYIYSGKVEDLKVEEGKAIGFEGWSLDKLCNLSEDERKRFIGPCVEEDALEMYTKILDMSVV